MRRALLNEDEIGIVIELLEDSTKLHDDDEKVLLERMKSIRDGPFGDSRLLDLAREFHSRFLDPNLDLPDPKES